VHDTWIVTVHTPLSALQHEPVAGCGHGFGLHEPPAVHTPDPQLSCATNEHAPVLGTQHVPGCGCGHGFGLHTCPWIHVLFPDGHWNCAVLTHAPVSTLQHVPVGGCGQKFTVHAAPAVNTDGATHCASVTLVHPPNWLQHAPVCPRAPTQQHSTATHHTRPRTITLARAMPLPPHANQTPSTTHPPPT
jgi:hypothetical protein